MLASLPDGVAAGKPSIWSNPRRGKAADVLPGLSLTLAHVEDAVARWNRFAPLLIRLFPDLPAGRIDSPLLPLAAHVAYRVTGRQGEPMWVKADHALPVTGCIKARGGVYEVLAYAETVAREESLLDRGDYAGLADPAARAVFASRTVAVGSTGNLGFSVGVIARALGFAVEVHMSHDAKAWKKRRLREIGARVVEHEGDYGDAVLAARAAFADRSDAHFVDDEDSLDLFLGYAAAAFDLRHQLAAEGVTVDSANPLNVYLPCGVGGAPGGVTFGLKLIFGDAVRCVFVEPVASPCMLVQLAAGHGEPVSVYDLGLSNRTAADGLAGARASMLVVRTVGELVEAVVTVDDQSLFDWMRTMWDDAGLRLEPSAAAGFAAVAPFDATLADPGRGTHLVWTTGGTLLPDEEFEAALSKASLQNQKGSEAS